MEFLKPYTALFEESLQAIPLPETPATLYDPQRYILSSGGKRIRPVLTLISCGLCGHDIKEALPAALAVELIHNFTLLHDDIMDQAQSRRGNETVHVKWDTPTAILAGDGMFVQAFLQLQNIPSDCDHKRLSQILLSETNRVCEGQALDMEFENRKNVGKEEYLTMIHGKTAALISASMQLGGLSACADREKIELLATTGSSLGLAFQIQDDLLDVIGDPSRFGKQPAGDIREGKKTFLMLTALEKCSADESSALNRYLDSRPLTADQIHHVIQIYRNCGVIDDAQKQIEYHYSKAVTALQKFAESTYKQDLLQLITYLKNREI